jgi:endonuclease/exonuclease/phosphatase family metal-dependent hydrolase
MVEGCLTGCAAGQPSIERPIRVLSLNMLHGYPGFKDLSRRTSLIEEEIRRLDADIVLLQEVPWTPETGNVAQSMADRLGLNYATLRANGNRRLIRFEEGEAILSRFPLREVEFAELKPRAGFFEHRVVLGAVIQTPAGDLTIFVTHLTNGLAEDNQGQSASLRAFVRSVTAGPAIVAGDFNAQESSPSIQLLLDDWHDLARTIDGEVNPTCCIDDLNDPSLDGLQKRIDYIFAVPGEKGSISAVETRRVFLQPFPQGESWLWASDHTGLLAVISLEP